MAQAATLTTSPVTFGGQPHLAVSWSNTPGAVFYTLTIARANTLASAAVLLGSGWIPQTQPLNVPVPSFTAQPTITIVCTTGGALGTAAFTFQVGGLQTTAPISSASSWGTAGVLIPNTYTTAVFATGTYVAGTVPDLYTVSMFGVTAHPQGTGPAPPTLTFGGGGAQYLYTGVPGTVLTMAFLDVNQNILATGTAQVS